MRPISVSFKDQFDAMESWSSKNARAASKKDAVAVEKLNTTAKRRTRLNS